MEENRIYIDDAYDKIIKTIFGNGEVPPTLFGIPIKDNDFKSITIAAYYIGRLEESDKYSNLIQTFYENNRSINEKNSQ